MYTRWTSHLKTDAEKQLFKNQVYSAKPVLERLRDMLEEDQKLLTKSEISSAAYSTPNWAYLQAHNNGRHEHIDEMKTLVDLDQQKGSINDPR